MTVGGVLTLFPSLEPGRGEALRRRRGEGGLTAGSSQEGLQQCAGETRAAPRTVEGGSRGKCFSHQTYLSRGNQVKMNRKGKRHAGEKVDGLARGPLFCLSDTYPFLSPSLSFSPSLSLSLSLSSLLIPERI